MDNMKLALKRHIESLKHKKVAPDAIGHSVDDEDDALTEAHDLKDAINSDHAPSLDDHDGDEMVLESGDAHVDPHSMHAKKMKLLEAMASHSGHGSLSSRAGDKARAEMAAIKGKK